VIVIKIANMVLMLEKKLKLRQILILILRILIITFIVLAFSRPLIKSRFPVFQSYSKTSAVIIIDNSISMELTDERGQRFNQAKGAVLKIMDKLTAGSEVAIIPMSSPNLNSATSLTKNFKYLKHKLEDLKSSNKPGHIDDALKVASAIFKDASYINRELFILSDFQDNIFDTINSKPFKYKDKLSSVYILPIHSGSKKMDNISVDSVNVISRILLPNRSLEIEAIINNQSSTNVEGLVVSMLFNKNRVAQRSVDIEAGSKRKITINAIPNQTGVISGDIEIEGDALDNDNIKHFNVTIPKSLKLLMVGNENKYLNAFFKNISSINSLFVPEYISTLALKTVDFKKYDAVVTLSGNFSNSHYDLLKDYLKNGGKLLVFANDSSRSSGYSDFLSDIGFGKLLVRKYSSQAPIDFDYVDKVHPIFDGVYRGETSTNKKIETPILEQAQLVTGGYSIAKTRDGAFIAETDYENGKAIFCGSGLEESWGNFVISGLFPTFIFKSILFLAASDNINDSYYIGNNINIKLPDIFRNFENAKLIDPNDKEIFISTFSLGNRVYFDGTLLSDQGNYKIESINNKLYAFSLNLNPTESNIKKYNKTNIEYNILRRINNDAEFNILENVEEIEKFIFTSRIGTEIWIVFILLALISAVAEMILSRSGKME